MKVCLLIARFTLLEACHNRVLHLAVAACLATLVFAGFLGALAITESREFQTAFMAASNRLIAVFVLASFVVSAQSRESNHKGQDLLLSLAMPRSTYFFGKLNGYIGVGLLLALIFTLPLTLLADPLRAVSWGATLAMELALVAAASLFFAQTLGHMPAAFSAIAGFYLLSRSLPALQLMARHPLTGADSAAHEAIARLVEGVALMMPRLDLYAQTPWLLESHAPIAWLPTIAQTFIYGILLCGAGLFDLYRKNA